MVDPTVCDVGLHVGAQPGERVVFQLVLVGSGPVLFNIEGNEHTGHHHEELHHILWRGTCSCLNVEENVQKTLSARSHHPLNPDA